jgi:hypothetical protein
MLQNSDSEKEIVNPSLRDTLIKQGAWHEPKILFADWLAGNWHMYPDGYKQAADMVVDAMSGEPAEDILILPTVFMYRHYVELKLKDIIIQLDKLSGTRMDPRDFGHQLLSLWSYLKDHLNCIRIECPDKELLPALTQLIGELSNLDPDSMHFRYATDKQRLNEMPMPRCLDMAHFKETMEKIKSGLDYIEAGIDAEREDRSIDAELDAEMRSYMDY